MTYNMVRFKKYLKLMLHLTYLLLINYLITQRSYKVMHKTEVNRYLQDLKHILIWTTLPGITEKGQSYFIKRRCPYLNCYFTTNRSFFGDTRLFDVIVFNQQDVSKSSYDLPSTRTSYQRFVFAANDSSDNYPVCDPAYDNFFNWTWSYKIDSTIVSRPVNVYNILEQDQSKRGNLKWVKKMEPIKIFLKNQLVSKSKAAAIFLDQCKSRSERENYLKNLQKELAKYNLTVDVFGECGPKKCRRRSMGSCYWRLKKNYFFYLALEDSFATDYITDGVIHAYKNNVVPVVYGAADYSRFLPPGSYLNAVLFPEEDLAKKMYTIMNNRQIYHDFFRWKNHYTIEKAPVPNVCAMCELLNQPKVLLHRITYTDFRSWWHPWFVKRCAENRYFSL